MSAAGTGGGSDVCGVRGSDGHFPALAVTLLGLFCLSFFPASSGSAILQTKQRVNTYSAFFDEVAKISPAALACVSMTFEILPKRRKKPSSVFCLRKAVLSV